MRSQGIEDAASPEAWLQQTLDEILARVRRLLDVNGCAFQVVDWERKLIRPAAAWFADDETREALAAVLPRPYHRRRPPRPPPRRDPPRAPAPPRAREGAGGAAPHRLARGLAGRRRAAPAPA